MAALAAHAAHQGPPPTSSAAEVVTASMKGVLVRDPTPEPPPANQPNKPGSSAGVHSACEGASSAQHHHHGPSTGAHELQLKGSIQGHGSHTLARAWQLKRRIT
jgi:hypothetical protein